MASIFLSQKTAFFPSAMLHADTVPVDRFMLKLQVQNDFRLRLTARRRVAVHFVSFETFHLTFRSLSMEFGTESETSGYPAHVWNSTDGRHFPFSKQRLSESIAFGDLTAVQQGVLLCGVEWGEVGCFEASLLD